MLWSHFGPLRKQPIGGVGGTGGCTLQSPGLAAEPRQWEGGGQYRGVQEDGVPSRAGGLENGKCGDNERVAPHTW